MCTASNICASFLFCSDLTSGLFGFNQTSHWDRLWDRSWRKQQQFFSDFFPSDIDCFFTANPLNLIPRTLLLVIGINLRGAHFSLHGILTYSSSNLTTLTTITSLIKETVRCEIPLCKYIPSTEGASIGTVVPCVHVHRENGKARACIMQKSLIIFTWTVHIPAGGRTLKATHAQPERIISGEKQNAQGARRRTSQAPRWWRTRQNSLLITFLPLFSAFWWAPFFSPTEAQQSATLGAIRKLLST